MAAPKRTRLEVERDRALISQMYCRRLAHWEIAAALNADTTIIRTYTISHDMVQDDIEVLLTRWRAERDLAEDKAQELAEIRELKRTYWRAWEASLEDKEQTVTEQVKGGAAKAADRMKAQVRKEGQSGNPAFLAGLLNCIDRECKLLGIDPPSRSSIEHDGSPNFLDTLRSFATGPIRSEG